MYGNTNPDVSDGTRTSFIDIHSMEECQGGDLLLVIE
jgi:hypothetical protein